MSIQRCLVGLAMVAIFMLSGCCILCGERKPYAAVMEMTPEISFKQPLDFERTSLWLGVEVDKVRRLSRIVSMTHPRRIVEQRIDKAYTDLGYCLKELYFTATCSSSQITPSSTVIDLRPLLDNKDLDSQLEGLEAKLMLQERLVEKLVQIHPEKKYLVTLLKSAETKSHKSLSSDEQSIRAETTTQVKLRLAIWNLQNQKILYQTYARASEKTAVYHTRDKKTEANSRGFLGELERSLAFLSGNWKGAMLKDEDFNTGGAYSSFYPSPDPFPDDVIVSDMLIQLSKRMKGEAAVQAH